MNGKVTKEDVSMRYFGHDTFKDGILHHRLCERIAKLENDMYSLEMQNMELKCRNQTFQKMLEASGQIGMRDDISRDLLEFRFQISKELILASALPNDMNAAILFKDAIDRAMEELNVWIREHKMPTKEQIFAEAYSEAMQNSKRRKS